jgi:hypothetical protein
MDESTSISPYAGLSVYLSVSAYFGPRPQDVKKASSVNAAAIDIVFFKLPALYKSKRQKP